MEGDEDLDEDDLISEHDIVECCGSLIVHEKLSGIVRFAHYTIQSFLRGHYHESLLKPLDLAKTRLLYMSFSAFQDGSCIDDDEFSLRREKYPFAIYAAHY